MTSSPNEKINTHYCRAFYCYTRKDNDLRDELEVHLSSLKHRYPFQTWFDGKISAGEDWERVIAEKINTANLILLLISPDFLASEHCEREMRRALERYCDGHGQVKVIPILLRPTSWENTPFSHLQMLPEGAQPIISWKLRDDAFLNVVNGVEKIIQAFSFYFKTAEEWIGYGNDHLDRNDYNDALQASEQAIRLDPNSARAYHLKGDALFALRQYREALTAYEEVFRLDSNDLFAQDSKNRILLLCGLLPPYVAIPQIGPVCAVDGVLNRDT